MILLALDLATSTGIAVGDVAGRPRCSTETLRGPHAAKFSQAINLVDRLIREHNPDLIAIEKAIASGVKGGEERVQLAMGWRTCVLSVGYRRGVKVVECPLSTVRAHFIGYAPKGQAKLRTLRRCEVLGWKAANADEADGCAVWAYARSTQARLCTPPPLPTASPPEAA